MGKNTFYFSHDYNARNDEKIKELIFKYGMFGYGIYWSIIEELYQNTNVLHLNYERIAYELRTDIDCIKSVINDFNLFVINDENFSSLSVQKRLDERVNKSKKAAESVSKRWNNTNVIRKEYERNTIKESKVKEINISFSNFWDLYDKKVGDKEKIERKWNSLNDKDRKNVIEYIPKYKLSQPNKKYRKDPSTFLNNKSWLDELIGLEKSEADLKRENYLQVINKPSSN
jgi:hypothetical protein